VPVNVASSPTGTSIRLVSGRATAQACLLTSLMLVPVGLLATLTGVAGYWYAGAAVVLGLWLSWLSLRFLLVRDDVRARRLFLASLAYLPLLMGTMVADRGSVVPVARREGDAIVIELPPQPAEAGAMERPAAPQGPQPATTQEQPR
jgi:hypothetical protein